MQCHSELSANPSVPWGQTFKPMATLVTENFPASLFLSFLNADLSQKLEQGAFN